MSDRWHEFDADEREFLREWNQSLEAVSERRSACPSLDLIRVAESDVLPEETRAAVVAHLEQCTACAALHRDLEDRQLAEPSQAEQARVRERVLSATVHEKQQSWSGWSLRLLPVAAALVVVVAGSLLWYWRVPTTPEVRPSAVVTSRPATSSLPTGTSVESVLRPEKARVKLPAASLLVWRGGQREQGKYVHDLELALVPYRKDDFDEAARQLQELARKYPRSADTHFYLGVSQLLLDRASSAIESLKEAERWDHGALHADIQWYLALAYQRVGKLKDAAAELNKLCGSANPYSRRACMGMQELSSGTVK